MTNVKDDFGLCKVLEYSGVNSRAELVTLGGKLQDKSWCRTVSDFCSYNGNKTRDCITIVSLFTDLTLKE